MDKYKRIYSKIAKDAKDITTTKDDFFFNVRLAMLTAKTTKSTISESNIKYHVEKMWVRFLVDIQNHELGLTEAINKVFDKYK